MWIIFTILNIMGNKSCGTGTWEWKPAAQIWLYADLAIAFFIAVAVFIGWVDRHFSDKKEEQVVQIENDDE